MPYNALLKGRHSGVGYEYFITAVTHQRKSLFTELDLARIIIQEFQYQASLNNAIWLSWVVMPDHFHALISLQRGTLQDLIKNVKGRSAFKINKARNTKGSVWQSGFFDRALRSEDDRKCIARYIVSNPLRANLVKNLADYPHWDAIWL